MHVAVCLSNAQRLSVFVTASVGQRRRRRRQQQQLLIVYRIVVVPFLICLIEGGIPDWISQATDYKEAIDWCQCVSVGDNVVV